MELIVVSAAGTLVLLGAGLAEYACTFFRGESGRGLQPSLQGAPPDPMRRMGPLEEVAEVYDEAA